ncbi:hypothetical protein QZH41_012352, partial [Actinostola sp. cb2023]
MGLPFLCRMTKSIIVLIFALSLSFHISCFHYRTHPHPFITILTNHPTCGQMLVDQVGLLMNRTYSHKNCGLNGVFQMLRPFLSFVLGDPRGCGDQSIRHQLQSALLESAAMELSIEESQQENLCEDILQFLICMMVYYKVDHDSIGHSSILIHQLAQWVLGYSKDLKSSSTGTSISSDLIGNIVDHLLSLTSAKFQNGFDGMPTLLILRRVQNQFPKVETMTAMNHTALPGQWLIQMETCAEITTRILRDDEAAMMWLSSLQSSLTSCGSVPCYVSMMLGVLLVMANKPAICSEVLDVVRSAVIVTPSQVTVGPVLKTLQSLSVCPSLRPLSVRLLLKLWRRQSRVFPHLQKALLSDDQDIKDEDVFLELQIAKAATIRDICRERPSQHGADLLVVLSSLIDKNAKVGQRDSSSVVVSLALQGIKHLCEAEVVDLCTAWRVLAAKLSQDKRPGVVMALCNLFGLAPSLGTDTQEYEEFKVEALTFLWKTTQHKVPAVSGAALDALSKFDVDDFKLCHIPERISNPIKTKLMSSKKPSTEEDLQDLECSVNASSPPGVAYMALLPGLHEKALTDFQTFLTSLVRQESSSIPRGVIHNATRANQSRDRSLTGIPSFLESQYEKSKTPGLTTGLAVGLLFSYEPPFEEHEGKRARRYHLNCARSYRHMLDALLHEVPIQPSEWHRNLLLPQAWTLFMTRLYHTCVLGRKEEIAMQFSRGHITDKSEVDDKQNNAWLCRHLCHESSIEMPGKWTRDIVTEQLQSASRGNPSVQGNSVLALAGLAVAVSTYVSQQSPNNQSNESDGSTGVDERHRAREWLCVVADTLMVVLDGNYKACTAPLTWCQQVSSPTSTASSLLARACAALSLSQMVPVLVNLDPDRIKIFTEALKLRTPGQSKAGSSSVIQVHCSLGLGLLLSKLYEEHFSELAGNEGYMMMTTALDVLETAAFSCDLENTEVSCKRPPFTTPCLTSIVVVYKRSQLLFRDGASLGIGLALSSLCKENIVDSRVHLLAMHQKLKSLLDNYNEEQNRALQTMSFSFSLVTSNAYHTGIITGEEANQCVSILQDLSTKNNEAVGVSLALGLLLHALLIGGHASVTGIVTQQLHIWEMWIVNKDLPSLQKLAGVNGLMGLLGSEQGFFQIDSTATDIETVGQGKAMSLLKTLKSFISSPQDIGLSSNIAWLLGHIYSAATSSPITKTSVPANYSYLPDTSILRAAFDFLVEAGKTGPHLQFSSHMVNAVLIAMVTGPRVVLPPANWASVLGPIMRSAFGKPECQKELYQSLSKLIFVVPSARVQEFLRGPVITGFDLVQIPNLKSVAIRCNLVGSGQAPIRWLNTCVTWLLDSTNQGKSCIVLTYLHSLLFLRKEGRTESAALMLWLILKALHTLKDSKHHKTDERLAWFMDVISQIRITATNSQQPNAAVESLSRSLTLLSGVAVCFARSHATLLIDGVFVAAQNSESGLIRGLDLELIEGNLKKLV